MGKGCKGVPLKAKLAGYKMPFKKEDAAKPTTWKQKQKVCTSAGLRAMSAPWAGCGKVFQLRSQVIYALCSLLFSRGDLQFKPLDHLELFAGEMAITKGEWKECLLVSELPVMWQERRSNAIPMDIRFGPDQDLLSDTGFCNALYQVLSLRPSSGGLWAAPVCSTWVFMRLACKILQYWFGVLCSAGILCISLHRSRGSTKRSKSRPMGCNTGVTRDHNVMVARLVLLLCIAASKGCWWMMEQPKGSLLEGHVAFQMFLRMLKKLNTSVSRCSTSLCWFGADTRKPLWVYSSPLELNSWSLLTFGEVWAQVKTT